MLSERSPIPETQLAAALIRRALDDALTPDERLAKEHLTDTPQGLRVSVSSGVTAAERTEAVRFLLDTSRSWSESRRAWCDAVGLDPAQLVRHALRHVPLAVIPRDIRLARRMGTSVPATTALREAA
ncbi:hypothetical protein [Falsiroseomonas oryzae]|uniref:hypothetical protein n=1 Tax=Falsiroseomonas oryzae TaxID=2766473 RepID=UPI0022EA1AE5|nr:hypothetical protein [Roseomonas sp. MO-31]